MSHHIQYSQSNAALENIAKIVNSTPNASIKVPTTQYKIKKLLNPALTFEYHMHCSVCQVYLSSTKSSVECEKCKKLLKTTNSNYFIYIPIKQQIEKFVKENFDQINAYRANIDADDTMTDIHDSSEYKRIRAKFDDVKILSFVVNTDGIAVHNSSCKSLWAIQLYQNYLHPSVRYLQRNILVAALFHGTKKPNMKDFFKPLLKEFDSIYKNGGMKIEKNGIKNDYMPIISHLSCDLPAKAEVLGTVNFNGSNACSFCFHTGSLIQSEKNSYVRYVYEGEPKLRTHQSIIEIYTKLKTNQPISGVKNVSCMVAAHNFDLINGVCIDYMHSVLLGVVSKLMSLWLDSANHKLPFYMKVKDQRTFNQRITNIKPPIEIARKPRSIADRKKFKANEYRSLLLYYLYFALSDIIPDRYVQHFRLLSSAIFLLLKLKITTDEIDLAEQKLHKFVIDYEMLYGKHNVTMNIHLLHHIANSVRNLGPLWAQSTFAFESNNGFLAKTRGRNNIIHSIAWNYTMKAAIHNLESSTVDAISLAGSSETVLIAQKEKMALTELGIKDTEKL